MRSLLAVFAAVAVLSACDTPLTARNEAVHDISTALGPAVMPLEGGVYRFDRTSAPQEDTVGMAFDAVTGERARPLFSDLMVVQRHDASQSYVTSYGNMSFHPFRDDLLVIDISADVSEASYLLGRAAADGRELIIYEYNCSAYDMATREAIGLTDQCRIEDVETVRAGLAALDLDALHGLRFEWTQGVPDRD